MLLYPSTLITTIAALVSSFAFLITIFSNRIPALISFVWFLTAMSDMLRIALQFNGRDYNERVFFRNGNVIMTLDILSIQILAFTYPVIAFLASGIGRYLRFGPSRNSWRVCGFVMVLSIVGPVIAMIKAFIPKSTIPSVVPYVILMLSCLVTMFIYSVLYTLIATGKLKLSLHPRYTPSNDEVTLEDAGSSEDGAKAIRPRPSDPDEEKIERTRARCYWIWEFAGRLTTLQSSSHRAGSCLVITILSSFAIIIYCMIVISEGDDKMVIGARLGQFGLGFVTSGIPWVLALEVDQDSNGEMTSGGLTSHDTHGVGVGSSNFFYRMGLSSSNIIISLP